MKRFQNVLFPTKCSVEIKSELYSLVGHESTVLKSSDYEIKGSKINKVFFL
jgi:hypothetical protein